MQRRTFIAFIGSTAISAANPLEATAQSRRPRLGMLMVNDEAAQLVVERRKALAELGWVDGSTVDILGRYANGDVDRLPTLAEELVALSPDLILTHSDPGMRAAANATRTIPVVAGAAGEEALVQFAGGLARPVGNVTGLTLVSAEQQAKCVELLKEAHPAARRIGILLNPGGAARASLSSAMAPLGLDLHWMQAHDESELDAIFAAMASERVDAVLVTASPAFNQRAFQKRASEMALARRIPLAATFEEYAREGALLTLSTDYRVIIRRAAAYVDKILRGAKPGDLPIERPTVFTLIVNLRAAKALGVTIPPAILVRADEVIE